MSMTWQTVTDNCRQLQTVSVEPCLRGYGHAAAAAAAGGGGGLGGGGGGFLSEGAQAWYARLQGRGGGRGRVEKRQMDC